MSRRTERVNSLLKEVISEVINKDLKNPHLPEFITITEVEVTRDLKYAKVLITVIGQEDASKQAIEILQSSSGFIAKTASRKVVLRYFPQLRFAIDNSLDKHILIDELVQEVQKEREERKDSL